MGGERLRYGSGGRAHDKQLINSSESPVRAVWRAYNAGLMSPNRVILPSNPS
jgi:hypothetical protein